MTLSLSAAQLKSVADQLFLLKDPAPAKLTKPTNTTGTKSLATKLDPLATDARFTDMGIAVVDFTADKTAPSIWLHNGDDAWRVGSTAKIAVLLAAVQLRDDVQRVKELNIVSTPAEFDELFAVPKLWGRSKDSKIRKIAGKDRSPRISTVLDVTQPAVKFIGPDPDDNPDINRIIGKLPAPANPALEPHLTWATVPDFAFSERLWLMGARSDNVAATSCISEIGVDYLKAIQRAYGLFDPANGMHLLLSGPYSRFDATTPVNRTAGAPKYRPFSPERNPVKDALLNATTRAYDNHYSWQPGSAAALAAYVIALMQDKFNFKNSAAGSTTIKKNLSNGQPVKTTHSYIVEGVEDIAKVNLQHTKIGLLGIADHEPGDLNTEFAYLETEETGAGKKMQYAVLVTGIRSKALPDGSPGLSAPNLASDIGIRVHRALLAL